MGVKCESCRDQFWDDCGKVRCGVSESRGVVAAPTATAAGELAVGIGEWEVVKGFYGSGRGELVTPPSPRSLSIDSNRSRQKRKRSNSRGRSSSRGGEVIDESWTKSESITSSSSTHPSLGRPYTPPLPDDSSRADTNVDVDAYGDSMRKHSADSNPSSKDAEGIHRLETLESSVHRTPVPSLDHQVDTDS
jgi:hypothetical protein